jgi:hypothetical protein
MPRSRHVSEAGYRFSASDALWALFVVAFNACGVVCMIHDVREYHWQQQFIAEFNARMPQIIVEMPYDPSVGERLIAEAAGSVMTIAVTLVGISRRRRRRRPVEVRVKWVETPQPRTRPVQAVRSHPAISAPPRPVRSAPERRVGSGALAAERLSAVVWRDHVARLEKETA